MRQQSAFLKQAGIVTIGVFRSTPESVAKYARESMDDETLALSDEKGSAYKSFQVKRTPIAPLFSSMEVFSNKKKYKKYIPNLTKEMSGVNGLKRATQLPADFCIDENGMVVDLFRAQSKNEHMSIDRLEAFIPEDKRCKCNKSDCLFASCRKRYEEIRKDAEAMLYMGEESEE